MASRLVDGPRTIDGRYWGAVRATAQMISYEIAMGLAIISIVITFGTLDLQDIVRQQGGVWFGFLPRRGFLSSR